jgi:hypothetical protein
MPAHATPTRRVELYLRGDTYGTYDRQRDVLGRVDGLAESGTVAEASVEASWARIRTPEQDTRDGALLTYDDFLEWAAANGYSLEPAFQRRQRSYIGTDVVHDVVVFPMASLAVYDEDRLRAVFPCSSEDGTIHYTVQDALEAFEAGEEAWFEQFAAVSVDRAEPRLDTVTP